METFEVINIPKPIDYEENPQRYKHVSLVVVSDTHNKHELYEVPDGDVFLHCGDFTNGADWRESIDSNILMWTEDFNRWLGTLPHRHKIVICGNHDIAIAKLSKEEIQSQHLTNCHYLKDELIEIEGISIYGCPWPSIHHSESKWHLIPPNIDILMTHVPPQFILDLAYDRTALTELEPCSACNNQIHRSHKNWGSKNLAEEIQQRIKPKVHCFGHVHDDQGYKYCEGSPGTLFINAAADFSAKCFKFDLYIDLEKRQQKGQILSSMRSRLQSCLTH